MDLLHREQARSFVRLRHNLIIAPEVRQAYRFVICPCLLCVSGRERESSKGNRFRLTDLTERMDVAIPTKRLFLSCSRFTGHPYKAARLHPFRVGFVRVPTTRTQCVTSLKPLAARGNQSRFGGCSSPDRLDTCFCSLAAAEIHVSVYKEVRART
jgi:hypothetical protein